MKLSMLQAVLGSALLMTAEPCGASRSHHHGHHHLGIRHGHGHSHERTIEVGARVSESKGRRRAGTCSLPEDPTLFAVTPNEENAGFAMSPNQPCTTGMYCPIACVPGMVMNQWQPGTTYVYPESENGGLLCGPDGTATKPFPDQPYCVKGTGAVQAVNNAGSPVAFCQTVLPGNEAMLIPTLVTGTTTIAVPGPEYWDGTSAHFYINAPGVSTEEGCVWGDGSRPIGNWAPFVAGANTVTSGETFVKIGINPIFQGSPLFATAPTFGLQIECPGGGCNGLPCSIDPATSAAGSVNSPDAADGAGGAAFCVVTVPQGGTANIVVFSTDGSGSTSSGSSSAVESSSSAPPTSASSSTPSSTSRSRSTTPTTTSTSSTLITTTSSPISSSSSSAAQSTTSSSTSSAIDPVFLPGGIFQENSSSVSNSSGSSGPPSVTLTTQPGTLGSSTASGLTPTTTKKSGALNADQGSAAVAGLIVAFVAATFLY